MRRGTESVPAIFLEEENDDSSGCESVNSEEAGSREAIEIQSSGSQSRTIQPVPPVSRAAKRLAFSLDAQTDGAKRFFEGLKDMREEDVSQFTKGKASVDKDAAAEDSDGTVFESESDYEEKDPERVKARKALDGKTTPETVEQCEGSDDEGSSCHSYSGSEA